MNVIGWTELFESGSVFNKSSAFTFNEFSNFILFTPDVTLRGVINYWLVLKAEN